MIQQASRGYLAALGQRPVVLPDGTRVPGFWTRLDVDPPDHDELHPVLIAEAFINDGRWIVQCACGSAQLANKAVERFFCVECAGEASGGKWVRVVFPPDAVEIEAVLARRPTPNQNWRPGEAVEHLEMENEIMPIAERLDGALQAGRDLPALGAG